MANDDSAYKGDSIESAMSRLASAAPAAGASATATRSIGRREYDQALSRRLDQIRASLGTNEPPPATPPATIVPPAPAVHIRVAGVSAIVVTALVSALLGAGAMWLALGGADHPPQLATPLPTAAAVQAMPAGVAMMAPAASTQPTQAALAPTPVAAPATTPLSDDVGNVQVRDLIERWRAAWAARDADAYLGCYSPSFVPADGSTRAVWAATRRKNILSRSDISVNLKDVKVTRIGTDQAKVVLLQDYASGSYRETAKTKTLLLTRVGDDWRIAGEWMGERP